MVADSIGWMIRGNGECGARRRAKHKEIFTNALLLWPTRAECTLYTDFVFQAFAGLSCSFVSQYNFLF